MANAIKSIGTKLRKTSGTPMYVGNLTSIAPIGIKGSEIDTTDLDSPDDFKEFIMGQMDGGEIAIKGWVKSETSMSAMLALALARSLEVWETTAPNGAKWFFQAYVKDFMEGEVTVDGLRNFEGTLRMSGKPVYASSGISA